MATLKIASDVKVPEASNPTVNGYTFEKYKSYNYYKSSSQTTKNNVTSGTSREISQTLDFSSKCPTTSEYINFFRTRVANYLNPSSYQFIFKKESSDECNWYRIKCFYSMIFDDKSCYYKHLGNCSTLDIKSTEFFSTDLPKHVYVNQIETSGVCGLYQVDCTTDKNLPADKNICRYNFVNDCSHCKTTLL